MELTSGYARLRNERIAYRVLGDGPIDLVITTGWWGSFDVEWEDPAVRLFLQQLAGFARVIDFDRRGSGASDPLPLDALPPWESFVEELDCVMDAAGSDQAALMAAADGGPLAMLFAATRPARVTALILFSTTARWIEDEDYPFGLSPAAAETLIAWATENWGTGQVSAMVLPSRSSDPKFHQWGAKLERAITSPSAIEAYLRTAFEADGRSIMATIRVPTLVLHRTSNPILPLEHGRYLAEHIEGARLVELPGGDVAPDWEYPQLTLAAVEEFLTGIKPAPAPDRLLTTVLFTDIVDSTRLAEELGDRRWRALLDLHDETTRGLVENQTGRVVKTTGDGVIATFDGPGRAIRGATNLQDELGKVDLRIRSGIHTGEVELRGDDVAGIAVHLAARVMALAGPGEILVSRTVRDLVVGSEIQFEDRGLHTLKGFDGEWQLFAVVPARFAVGQAGAVEGVNVR